MATSCNAIWQYLKLCNMEKFTIELSPYVQNSWECMASIHRGTELESQFHFKVHEIYGEVVFDFEDDANQPSEAIINFITEIINNR